MKKCLVLMLVPAAAFAATISWLNAVTGSWMDSVNWNSGTVPGSADYSYVDKPGVYTVTFPAATEVSDPSATRVTAASGSILSLDVAGSWLKYNDIGFQGNVPFRTDGGGHTFNIESVVTANKYQMYWENARFTAAYAPTVFSNILERGFFNFYDPKGTRSNNSIVLGHWSGQPMHLVIRPGVQTRWSTIYFRGYNMAVPSRFTIEGGYNEFLQMINFAHTHDGSMPGGRRQIVDVNGGTNISYAGLTFPASQSNSVVFNMNPGASWLNTSGAMYLANGLASYGELNINGGSLVTSNDFNVASGQNSNARLALNSGVLGVIGGSLRTGAAGSTSVVSIAGGVMTNGHAHPGQGGRSLIDVSGGQWIGTGGGIHSIGQANNTETRLTVNGGTMWWNGSTYFARGTGSIGGLYLTNGLVSFGTVQLAEQGYGELFVAGGIYTNRSDLYIGSSTGTLGRVVLSGGESYVGGVFLVGNKAATTGRVEVAGGRHTTAGAVRIGNYGIGSMRVSGGEASFISTGDNTLAYFDNAYGKLNVDGGTAAFGGTLQVGLNPSSVGEIFVSNGTLRVNNANIGYKGTGLLYVADGVITNTGTVMFGTMAGSSGQGVFAGGRSFSPNTVYIGKDAGASGSLAVSGGTHSINNLYVGYQGSGAIELSKGVLNVVGNDTGFGWLSGGTGTLSVTGGELRMDSWKNLFPGRYTGSFGRILVSGGSNYWAKTSLSDSGSSSGTAGDSEMIISGGTNIFHFLAVGRGSPALNRVYLRIEGGTNAISPNISDSGLSLSQNGVVEITGGTVSVNHYIRMNNNTTTMGSTNILRMTGGTLALNAGGSCNCADSGGSGSARLELNGGTFVTTFARGWNGSINRGGACFTVLSADGGKLVPNAVGDGDLNALVGLFDLAELGEQGLTVEVPITFMPVVRQVFVDKQGANGRLIKTGPGTLNYQFASTNYETVVAGGKLLVKTGGVPGRGVVVTNGAMMTLESGYTGFALERLTLGTTATAGYLTLDPTATVTVTAAGGLSIGLAGIYLSSTADGEYPIIKAAGDIRAAGSFRNVRMMNIPAGKYYSFNEVYNGGTDQTTVTLKVATGVPSLAASQIWTGAESQNWNTVGNWNSAVPSASEKAVFDNSSSVKAVSIDVSAEVGGIEFSSDSPYTVSGGTLSVQTLINVEKATNTIASSVQFSAALAATVGPGAGIEVSGPILNGGIIKSGKGLLKLSGANVLGAGIIHNAGITEITSANGFGFISGAPEQMVLRGDTIRYSGPSTTTQGGFMVDTGDGTVAAVFDAATDIAINGTTSVGTGAFIKKGPGTLTVNLAPGAASSLVNGVGKSSAVYNNIQDTGGANLMVFPADGSTPSAGYAGFNLVEGGLRFVGPRSATVNLGVKSFLGGNHLLPGTAGTVFEVDGCTAYLGAGSRHTWIGAGVRAASLQTNHVVRVRNGGYLWSDTLNFGLSTEGGAKTYPTLDLDNGEFVASYLMSIGNQYASGESRIYARNGSKITTPRYEIYGLFDFNFEGSELTQTSATESIYFYNGAGGRFRVAGGSKISTTWFNYNNIGRIDDKGIALVYDNAEVTLRSSRREVVWNEPYQSVTLEGAGVTFVIPAGIRYEMTHPIDGAGSFTKSGAGEYVFGPGLAIASAAETNLTGKTVGRYTGPTYVNAGTLTVSNGTIRTEAQVTVAAGAVLNLSAGTVAVAEIGGAGSVSNGIFSAIYKLPETAVVTDLIQLADLTARLTVDFGRTSENPLVAGQELAVARVSGTTVSTTGWRGTGTGGNVNTAFVIREGVVYAQVKDGGTRLILR